MYDQCEMKVPRTPSTPYTGTCTSQCVSERLRDDGGDMLHCNPVAVAGRGAAVLASTHHHHALVLTKIGQRTQVSNQMQTSGYQIGRSKPGVGLGR